MKAAEFEQLFHFELKKYGFKRRASHWYFKSPEVIHVINLQKSRFGDIFYINVGLVPDSMPIAGLPFPREYKCPIRIRLGSGMPEKEDAYIKEILDMDSDIPEHERKFGIVNIIEKYISPIIANTPDIESIKKAIKKRSIIGMQISKEGLEFLDIISNEMKYK